MALFLFGLDPILRASTVVLAHGGGDPTIFMWSLVWWPHAILSGLDPIHPHVIFAPGGADLTLVTSIPVLALLAAPVTYLAGPVVAYNLLAYTAPIATAAAAFALCRHVAPRFEAALVGGFAIGFSPYVLGQLMGHTHLVWFAPVPLLCLLFLRRVDGIGGSRAFVLLSAAALVVLFGTSVEAFMSTTFFGAVAIAVALLAGIGERRPLLAATARLGLAYALALAVVSPLVYAALRAGVPESTRHPEAWSLDLLNLVFPTQLTEIGGRTFAPVARTFSGGRAEASGYVPLPAIALAVWQLARERPRVRAYLAGLLVVFVVCALGPYLHVGGVVTVRHLPWRLLDKLPMLDHAIPARFAAFTSIVVGVLVARALASSSGRARVVAAALGLLTVAMLLPALRPTDLWPYRPAQPAFFTDGTYKRYVERDETVLLLPFSFNGDGMLWQAQTHMWFRQVGGYVGGERTPAVFGSFGAQQLLATAPAPTFEHDLAALLRATGARTVLVEQARSAPWAPLLAAAGLRPRSVGGMLIYDAAPLVR